MIFSLFPESYLTSLAHTRAGVPEAIVSSGAVFKLLHLLKSDNDLVRIGAAQALGKTLHLLLLLLVFATTK